MDAQSDEKFVFIGNEHLDRGLNGYRTVNEKISEYGKDIRIGPGRNLNDTTKHWPDAKMVGIYLLDDPQGSVQPQAGWGGPRITLDVALKEAISYIVRQM